MTIAPRNSVSYRHVLCSFRPFQGLLLALTGLVALSFVVETSRFLPVQSEHTYPQAAGVLSAQRWAHGLALYEDYRQPPYTTASFPPVWYGILALAARAGVNDLGFIDTLRSLLSLASPLAILVLGFSWYGIIGHPIGLSLLTPLFYLSLPNYSLGCRSCLFVFLGLLLVFLALYLVSRRYTTMWVPLAAILAAVGFLIRHNAVVVPIAACAVAVVAQTVETGLRFFCGMGSSC